MPNKGSTPDIGKLFCLKKPYIDNIHGNSMSMTMTSPSLSCGPPSLFLKVVGEY